MVVRKVRPILKRLRDRLVYLSARLFLSVGKYIPVGIGYALGEAFGSLGYLLAQRDRERALLNLRTALGEEYSSAEIESIARGMFVHFGRVLFEVLRFQRLTQEEVDKMVDFEGLDLVRKALDQGRGVVVATGHIGNWELIGAAAALKGIPLNVIARKINDPRLNKLVVDLRAKVGVRAILRESPRSAREILRSLRRGEMLALLIDQDLKVEGTFVPFFGRPAYTPIGAAALAQGTGSLFLAACIQRLGPGKHLVRAVPIDFPESENKERAIIEATARATAQLEKWIRERPEQWSWNHERWRTQPPPGMQA
jgi:KDO2-lipid IV(A) lauroyltransferase